MLNSSFSHRRALVEEDPKPKDARAVTPPKFQHEALTRKAAGTTRQSRSSWPSFQWWLMAIPSFIISAYGAAFFTGNTPGDSRIKARIIGSLGGVIHIGGSLVAMGLGPFQFLPQLRQRYIQIHRWLGWVYVLAVTTGGIAAFYVTFNSEALTWGKVGFGLLALGWLESARRSIVAIRSNGDVKSHQAWMTRNFALTYAAVMLRWQLPLMIAAGMEVKFALSITGYISWIPNLWFVERFVLNRS
ncbi:DUF2306 domain-containing protein [Colletotrichum scovillei]|uniref:DUF2306 domain-containing protein n=1 Tax=Colletotrichum scovillei TaxID=1209932 RepID=A0A9P7U398_9PEZI|nr:DUF2306 domain-containing protein [Colletotrichum scovillei]KAG7040466.1 DUF2306 domain-containing protein [Colletotrichum scovillei]KAG7060514.1 DUF2306 domain-containing protein [Colletotrichum scovillei]